MNKIICLLLFIIISCEPLVSQVQVRARIDKDKILIGEPIVLTIEAYAPLSSNIEWLAPDSLPHFEIISKSEMNTVNRAEAKKMEQIFQITGYDSGTIAIWPFSVLVDKQPYYTDSLFVQVAFAPFNPFEDYRANKDIIEIPHPFSKYIPWVLAILALPALFFSWRYIFNKKNKAVVIAVPEIQLTAYEKAIKKLRALNYENVLPVKYFYAEMNSILKEYLQEEFNIHTKDKTNEEVSYSIKSIHLNMEIQQKLQKALQVSDYVKFAKFLPDDELNKKNKAIIIETIEWLHKNKPL